MKLNLSKDEYSSREAAQIIGIARETLHRHIRSGYMPGARRYSGAPGSPYVIPRASLRAYLDRMQIVKEYDFRSDRA